ncbi:MAG TPA: TolC family protein [Usitatibacter sp.]|jgi:outer membrane protein TolC|nr:TolC family protein [Usitatibacter sp.]
MKHLFAAALIAAFAPLAAPNASAADVPLTLAEAQRRAVDRSAQVTAQEAAIAAARHMAVAAGERPDPILKGGVNNLPVTGSERLSLGADFMTMRYVGLAQELTRGEKLELRARRYELEAEKSTAGKDAAIAAIQRDTALAWIDRYYAEAMSRVIDEQAAQARLEIEAAESAYGEGHGSQADVFAAHASLSLLDDRAEEYHRRAATARVALARWVGERAGAPLNGKPPLESIRFHHHDVDAQLASHPMIAMLAREEDIAATEAKLARAELKPDWSVELMYSNRGPAFSDMVSIGISVPLQWDRPRRQDQAVAAKLAMADEARALREDALRAHAAEIQAMTLEWESDRDRMARYDRELLPLARERSAAALATYRGGKSSLMDVLSARRGEIEVRMQALQLEMETARMWAQLNYVVPDETLLPPRLVPDHAEEHR